MQLRLAGTIRLQSRRHRTPTSWIPRRQRKQCFSAQTPLRTEIGSLGAILKVSKEVSDAIATNKPVVALESTIYTHGALGIDLQLESIVRENGAVPAVIGVFDGVPTVGLTPGDVQRMIHEGAKKVSRRDLAYLVGMVSECSRARSLPRLLCWPLRIGLAHLSEIPFSCRAWRAAVFMEERLLLVLWCLPVWLASEFLEPAVSAVSIAAGGTIWTYRPT